MPAKSKQNGSKDKGRVKVEDLPRKEEELKGKEAKQIKGGGALGGGVVIRKPIGEEIPQ